MFFETGGMTECEPCDEQLGWLCLSESKINFVSKKCFDSPSCLLETVSTGRVMLGGIFDGLYCKLCFLLTEYLAGLMHTIQKGARPACEFLAEALVYYEAFINMLVSQLTTVVVPNKQVSA